MQGPPGTSATALAKTAGSASSVSRTEVSFPACTMAVVPKVAKSIAPGSGGQRLNSVKFVSMPPPISTPGKAARASAMSASGRGSGHGPSGWWLAR